MARVLIVDDDPQVRGLLERIVQRAGHETEVLDDGWRVVEVCCQISPDVVITDLLMPNQDGLETIQLLRREIPDVKIIAITGAVCDGPLDFLAIARKFGASVTLRKPFRNEELLTALREVLA